MSTRDILAKFPPFLPEFDDSGKYNKNDALSFALACQLAYEQDLGEIERIVHTWAGWESAQVFPFDKRLGEDIDTQGLVAANDTHTIIAFRGSSGLPDWLTNLQAAIDPGPLDPKNSKVHEGFQDALFPALLTIGCHLGNIKSSVARDNVWVTGHSLGGALATLLVAMLLDVDEMSSLVVPKGLYTFGAPRVGNHAFQVAFDQRFSNTAFRVVNQGDLVPHLPPEFFGPGFSHTGKSVLFLEDGTREEDPDGSVWRQFRNSLGAWLGGVGKEGLVIKDSHILRTGYLPKLAQDLD